MGTNFLGNKRLKNFADQFFLDFKTKETQIVVDIWFYFFIF